MLYGDQVPRGPSHKQPWAMCIRHMQCGGTVLRCMQGCATLRDHVEFATAAHLDIVVRVFVGSLCAPLLLLLLPLPLLLRLWPGRLLRFPFPFLLLLLLLMQVLRPGCLRPPSLLLHPGTMLPLLIQLQPPPPPLGLPRRRFLLTVPA